MVVTILKHDGVRQWGWDDIPYMTWKIKAMFETTNQTKICQLSREIRKHNGAFYVGLLDGLLGVAGIMTLLVMTGIIPENSLRKTHQ